IKFLSNAKEFYLVQRTMNGFRFSWPVQYFLLTVYGFLILFIMSNYHTLTQSTLNSDEDYFRAIACPYDEK
ncbi:hypothetical protein, partial [Klebsiella pneumoniae]|uniref:hypothetical protein n=1 Tax=Klebsiella pneumoniae TaxID=573 RepID=UPI0040557006